MSLYDHLAADCVDIINQYNDFPRHYEDELVITDENRHEYIKTVNIYIQKLYVIVVHHLYIFFFIFHNKTC